MGTNKEYFAFISYKSEDAEWAMWIQHELEHYHLPASFNGRSDVPQELRPVFRDIDELSAGNLPEQIKQALINSQNLIVICSPQAAGSPWVNQEVETFISLGKTNRIFPFIVEGSSPSEFFPPALLNLPKDKERLGGDVSKKGRDAAFVKVVAGMLGVTFDSLWNRYEKEKAEEERKVREQRDCLLRIQSRLMAKEAKELILEHQYDTACLIALEALPKNMELRDRPYVREAEEVLRDASIDKSPIIRFLEATYFNDDGSLAVTTEKGYFIRIWNSQTNTDIKRLHLLELAPEGLDNYQQRIGQFDKIFWAPYKGLHCIIISCRNCLYLLDYMTEKSFLLCSSDTDRIFRDIVVSPNQKYLCCIAFSQVVDENNYDRQIDEVWVLDSDSFSCIKYVRFHDRVSISISPDSRFLASVCGREVHLWNLEDFSFPYKYKSYDVGSECCFVDNNNLIFSRKDNSLVKWNFMSDCHETKLIYTGKSAVTGIICKEHLIALSTASNEIVVIDINQNRQIAIQQWHSRIELHSFSEDRKKVRFKDYDSFRTWDFYIRSANHRLLYYHPNSISCAVYSTDHSCIVSASESCIKIWDTYDQNVKQTINIESSISQIAINSDKNKIYFADEDGVWCMDYVLSHVIKFSSEKVLRMLLTPDNKSILTVNERSISFFDAITLLEGMKIILPDEQSFLWANVDCIAISPNGELIAAQTYPEDPSKMVANLWDSKTGHLIVSIMYDDGGSLSPSISFTHDTNQIIIDGHLQWDIKNNMLKERELFPKTDEIVIDAMDLLIKTNISLQSLIDETRERLSDYHLSQEERKKYYLE